jgi:hypothetical protein
MNDDAKAVLTYVKQGVSPFANLRMGPMRIARAVRLCADQGWIIIIDIPHGIYVLTEAGQKELSS